MYYKYKNIKLFSEKLDIFILTVLSLLHIRSKADMNTLIERAGLMDAEAAAKRLGVTIGCFRTKIAPNIGRWVGNKKMYTEPELELWLREQIGEANIKTEGDNSQNNN